MEAALKEAMGNVAANEAALETARINLGQLLQLRRALEDGRLKRPDGEQAKVTLTLEDGSAYAETGRLEFSEVTVDRGTGAVTLRASFPNPDHVLLPGMFVRAQVEEGLRPDAILVPQQGVTHDRLGQPTRSCSARTIGWSNGP